MKQGATLEFQWGGGSSLVEVRDSSPPVTQVFLSSCGVLVSSSQSSVAVPLYLWWGIISRCGVAALF